ncbi:MAG TPA: hypothetical protein VGJ59_11400 [Jatrophihabitantaceae bacterium]|jgi:hypothetical protein
MTIKSLRTAALVGAAALTAGGASAAAAVTMSTTSQDQAHFALVRSTASLNAGCLVNATARVKIKNHGPVEVMTIDASGLPKNTEFDVFVNQLPNAPFGLSWYQGDLETNSDGDAHGKFVGRFSIETFTVAPGTGAAPVVHDQPIKDADSNPATAPVHQYHIGVWFNSPVDAAAAGCANVVTPFNGDHNAGPQALSTRQFPDLNGPLAQIKP